MELQRPLVVAIYPDGKRRIRVRLVGWTKRPRTTVSSVFVDERPLRTRNDLEPVLRAAVAKLPWGAAVPVFLVVHDELAHLPWHDLFLEMVDADLRDRVQPVRMPTWAWSERAPLTLPLTITALDQRAASAMRDIHARPGVLLVEDEITATTDIVIATELDSAFEKLARARLAPAEGPRLLVVPRVSAGEPPWPSATAPPPTELAVATLGAFGAQAVRDLTLSVMHDEPLYTAVKKAGGGTLWATPATTESLLLRPVRKRILEDILKVEMGVPRMEQPTSTTPLRNRPIVFDHEHDGIEPMAGIERELDEIRKRPLKGTAPQPTGKRTVDLRFERTRDTYAEPYNASMADAQWIAPHTSLKVNTRYTLRCQIGKALPGSLTAGKVTPIDEALPPPGPEGFELEVVCFAQDFTLLSPPGRLQRLPRQGPSDPVFFDVRTPAKPHDGARLRCSIYHQGNLIQSFQVRARVDEKETRYDTPPPSPLRRTTTVDGDGNSVEVDDDNVTTAILDFTRTDDFQDAERFGARKWSLAINNTHGDHTVMIKGEVGKPVAFNVPAGVMTQRLNEFRDALKGATALPSGWPKYPVSSAPQPEFVHDLYAIAKAGYELRTDVIMPNPELERALLRIQKLDAPDITIQVARIDPASAFPWAAIYDFDLPLDEPKAACTGVVVVDAASGKTEPCKHTCQDKEILCARGFWGVRFRLEEIMSGGPGVVAGKQPLPAQEVVRVAANASHVAPASVTGPLASRWPGAPHRVSAWPPPPPPSSPSPSSPPSPSPSSSSPSQPSPSPSPSSPSPSSPAVLDPQSFLFAGPPLPAVCIVVAHHETVAAPAPHLKIADGAIIELRRVRRAIQPKWSVGPVVLLMCCQTGIGHAPSSWIQPLISKGAAAVVATEADLFGDLAAHVSREIVGQLLDGVELGDATRRVRAALLQQSNPLAFVFVAFGDATLRYV